MVDSSCPYKYIFGKVGKGIHAYRIMNIAIVDVIMTIIGAYILHRFVFPKISFYWILAILFGLGIVAHRLFCFPTTIDTWLFSSANNK